MGTSPRMPLALTLQDLVYKPPTHFISRDKGSIIKNIRTEEYSDGDRGPGPFPDHYARRQKLTTPKRRAPGPAHGGRAAHKLSLHTGLLVCSLGLTPKSKRMAKDPRYPRRALTRSDQITKGPQRKCTPCSHSEEKPVTNRPKIPHPQNRGDVLEGTDGKSNLEIKSMRNIALAGLA